MPRNPPSQPNFLRKVLRVTGDGILVHFHLECGHLITQRKSELTGAMPTSLECWACREEDRIKRQ